MQKAKTFVSQRISTTHKVLIWRPSRKKNSWTQRGTQTRKVTVCRWLQCTDPTHWPGLCLATVALLQASCALGVRAKALPRGHSSWRHPRSRRHPATPRRSSPVPRGIRSHPSARKPAFGRQRAWHHSTRPPKQPAQLVTQELPGDESGQCFHRCCPAPSPKRTGHRRCSAAPLSLRCTASPMLEIEKQHGRPGTPAQRRGMSVLSPGAVALPFTLCT